MSQINNNIKIKTRFDYLKITRTSSNINYILEKFFTR